MKIIKISHFTKLFLLIICVSEFGFGQTNNEKANGGQVLLNVSVLGERSVPIRELKAENFRVFENKKPLEISHFENENSPLSVGFLIDVSRSMETNVDLSREAILTFMEESNPQNEYFVTAFHKKLDLLSEFTNFAETTKIVSASPYFSEKKKNGETLLYEAMISGIEELSKAKNQKRILFVFWDANDDYASPKYKEVKKLVKEKNMTIFLFGFYRYSIEYSLKELAEISGGIVTNPAREGLIAINGPEFLTEREAFLKRFSNLAEQLKNQYTIGFKPDLSNDKKKWRDLKVKLEIPKELKKKIGIPALRHRQGYYPFSELVTSN